MPSPSDILNTQYLHFDAFSIKDAIKQYLSNDERFTDFIYEGSNLSVIIDLVALMYQCLLYNLNNTASESMFSDAQLYDSINRIVKLIGYNPKGYTTSVVNALVENTNTSPTGETTNEVLNKYAFVNTGLKDSHANTIYYSTINDIVIEPGSTQNITLYNGIWKLYNAVNVAKGGAYETFYLQLVSNLDTGKYIAYPYIDVYVKNTKTGEVNQWTRVDNIYDVEINDNSQQVNTNLFYELRLNPDGTYSIKCGDGIHGSTFPVNSEIYVVYLQSNGAEGQIAANTINNISFNLGSSYIGLPTDIFNKIFKSTTSNIDVSQFKATNKYTSSIAKLEETTDEVRENAPISLNIANRLITASDVENWFKLKHSVDILDIKAMNNWEYITNFYAWLYNIGNRVYKNGQKYINKSILSKYDLNYSDAADSNSIYCWLKTQGNTSIQKDLLQSELKPYKPLTSNIVLIPALTKMFAICLAPEDYVKKYYINDDDFDKSNENYIEITIDDTLAYSPILIKAEVKNKILSFFSPTNFSLGTNVNLNELLNSITSINGIINVKTCFIPRESEATNYSVVSMPGIYFATWTNEVIAKGDDLVVSNSNRILEKFQFPALLSTILDDKIKIITHNSNIAKVN